MTTETRSLAHAPGAVLGVRSRPRARARRAHVVAICALVASAASVVAPAPRAQDLDPDVYARLLVQHPLERRGLNDAVIGSWIDLVETEPSHPLAEAALALVASRLDASEHPAGLAARIAELSPDEMTPAAARRLAILQAEARALHAPASELGDDLYPGWLSRYWVLGPLAPAHDATQLAGDAELFADPGFDREHAGAEVLPLGRRTVRWREAQRAPTSRFVFPAVTAYPHSGWLMTAVRFDVPEATAAWLEIDVGTSGLASSSYATDSAGYAWSLNGAAPRVVDLFGRDAPAVHRELVPLRAGRNRLVLRSSVVASISFAVRVLGPDGRPLPGLVEADDEAPLGPAAPEGLLAAHRGAQIDTSESYLRGMSGREPDAEALLGLLLSLDRRQPEGHAHVRAALAEGGSVGVRALLARLVADARYLPAVWRSSRARELAREVIAADPEHVGAGLYLAEVWAGEDREEEALELLQRLSAAHPEQPHSELLLSKVYQNLEMTAQAEQALEAALARAPTCPAALDALAEHARAVGQTTRAIELAGRALESGGASAKRLADLARWLADNGRPGEAEPLFREMIARSGREFAPAYASFLVDQGRLDEALASYDAWAQRYPHWSRTDAERADVALRAGDAAAEERFLRAALDVSPHWRMPRERLRDATGVDATAALFERFDAGRAELLAGYDEGAWSESVVRLLDLGVLHVFEDGGREEYTHEIVQVRDLAGCESEGSQQLGGDVLRLVVVKPDGAEYEAAKVGNEYIMPSLEPGDFIERVTRRVVDPPRDGVLRLGSWTFQSNGEPFVLSRYVVSLPDALDVTVVRRNLDEAVSEREVDDGGRRILVFEARDRPRVLGEPGAPPPTWYLPWVEIGMARPTSSATAQLRLETVRPTLVTPEVRAAAEQATAGVEGDEARARALHAFVGEALDQRQAWSRSSATEALLAREGNPALLYAALLSAAGIDHDLVWARSHAPDADPEPDPAFVDAGYWRGKLLVLVRPSDGPAAWCDLSMRTMPYGMLMDDAPRAPAYAVGAGEFVALPDVPLEERPPGLHVAGTFRLDEKGGCAVEGSAGMAPSLAYMAKEPLGEVPSAMLNLAIGAAASEIIPGIDVEHYVIEGLDDDRPVAVTVRGRVRAFLDDDGTRLSCKLPFPAIDLEAQFGGERERRLPFFLAQPIVMSATARLVVPPSLRLVEPPRSIEAECAGGTYRFTVERVEDIGAAGEADAADAADAVEPGSETWVVRREVRVAPFAIEAGQFDAFRAFCARVDEAERSRLRFERAEG